ncbi:MAG: hypothetical protein IKC59_03705, partial [Clostridia bacterium]|nr:hypothetical protein [Clostridia bacterium]
MKLHLEGNINTYYVQTLCMIFFPGSKFSEDATADPNAPELSLRVLEENEGCRAYAILSADGKQVST